MRVISTPPVASTLLEAMRAFGYSFEAAVADLIDNAIAANARNVDVFFPPQGDAYLAILDDGDGMTPSELVAAMRHGSRSSLDPRAERDLGRFGLGLKTASLSQARKLTVVTKQGAVISGAEWDLDEVSRLQDWALLSLDETDCGAVPMCERLIAIESGTLVVWRTLDRALAGESSPLHALRDHIDRTRAHLSLVFHRYLEGTRPVLRLAINGMPVAPLDPFLRSRTGRQSMPPEPLSVQGHRVLVEAHVLPHISKLSAAEIAQAGGEDGLRRNQGFYVYRNRRLVIWGTWFRLVKQEEMTKLARVIVDIPNSLDHLWSLDVKKSTAHPPEQVRLALKQIVDRIADGSRRVYTFRGNLAKNDGVTHAWQRVDLRAGRFRYQVNRQHQLFNALRQAVPEAQAGLLERFVQMVEDNFPYEAAYAEMAADHQPGAALHVKEVEEQLRDTAFRLLEALADDPEARRVTLAQLQLMEPFSRHPEITAGIKEEFA
jgi:hypothetical protein